MHGRDAGFPWPIAFPAQTTKQDRAVLAQSNVGRRVLVQYDVAIFQGMFCKEFVPEIGTKRRCQKRRLIRIDANADNQGVT